MSDWKADANTSMDLFDRLPEWRRERLTLLRWACASCKKSIIRVLPYAHGRLLVYRKRADVRAADALFDDPTAVEILARKAALPKDASLADKLRLERELGLRRQELGLDRSPIWRGAEALRNLDACDQWDPIQTACKCRLHEFYLRQVFTDLESGRKHRSVAESLQFGDA